VLAALAAEGDDWSAEQRTAILSKSPTSTRIAFRQIREGGRLGFEDCMRLEYRLARYCMTHPDFYEGVRAVIIEKDNRPRWRPATLAEATDAYVADAFAPLGEEELQM
jgi:enoyl-CoA hydratase